MIRKNRFILKSGFGKEFISGQKLGYKKPKNIKDIRKSRIINLPEVDGDIIINRDIFQCMINRKTHRLFDVEEKMDIKELSFILMMTQGVRQIRKDNDTLKRYVPSASGRHCYETYIVVNNVENFKKGVYRYLPLEHSLILVYEDENISNEINKALNGQIFCGRANIVLVWASIPERMEWRFGELGEKLILLDGGHICQNLYLAAEALDLGACSIADYNQEELDKLLGIDGIEEISTYIGICGKKRKIL